MSMAALPISKDSGGGWVESGLAKHSNTHLGASAIPTFIIIVSVLVLAFLFLLPRPTPVLPPSASNSSIKEPQTVHTH